MKRVTWVAGLTSLLLVSLGLFVVVSSTNLRSASGHQPTSPPIAAATAIPDPEGEAIRRVVPRGQCVVGGDVLLPTIPDLERRVDEAGGPGNWLEQDRIYIGTLDEAVRAFNGELTGERDGSAWIIVRTDTGTERGVELRKVADVAGTSVWWAANMVEATACPTSEPTE